MSPPESAQMWINSLNRSSIIHNSIFNSRLLEQIENSGEIEKIALEAPEWLEIAKFGFGELISVLGFILIINIKNTFYDTKL